MTQQIETYENEAVISQIIGEAKENIWLNINESIIELWPSIEIIFEQKELLHKSKVVVAEAKEDLIHKPGHATKIIKVLNSKKKEDLEEYGIEDKTEATLEVRRVHTKINLMLQLKNKCHNLELQIKKFHRKFNSLHVK